MGCPIILGQPIKIKKYISKHTFIRMKLDCRLIALVFFQLFTINSFVLAQTYFGLTFNTPGELLNFNLSCNCLNCCNQQLYSCCSPTTIAQTTPISSAVSISPDGHLYGLNTDIYEIDTLTGNYSVYFDMPPEYESVIGLIAIGSGIFYSMIDNIAGNGLLEINTNTGIITNLGSNPIYPCYGDLTLANNIVYYPTWINNFAGTKGIASFILSDPTNVTLVMNIPTSRSIYGLTATDECNILIGTDIASGELVLINLMEGSITPVCNISTFSASVTSTREFEIQDCEILLDLDCDDSSGAPNGDYNAPEFTCLSNGVQIADEDIKILYDFPIVNMTIQIVGNVPDGPLEVLDMASSVPNINASGIGTDMITLSNTGGAKSTDFIDALQLILYQNTADPLTPGPRTVQVQFTTASGAMSNIAIAFIEVTSLPLVDVDLGPDQYICEGESTIFDAGIPGAIYTWSTGVHTQTITAFESGQYMVTVADGLHCPGKDTVELNVVPIIQVALEGDDEICDNQSAELIIQTNTPFSLTVDISSNPGSPFHFTGINEDFTFNDFPIQTTIYTITNVSASDSACFELTDPIQIVDVYPTYLTTKDATICEGDSIWLGFYWETEPGVYENTLNTIHQCDSTVITTLTVLPAIQIAQTSTTCDSAAAGVFVTFLNNPTGCDTMVTTTVTLLSSDTTLINLLSCNISNVGTTTQTLTNQSGCDSLIITTTSWIPPADTTSLFQTTCDSALIGVFPQFLIAQNGCDSIVITSVTMAPSDTTYLSGVSCDSASIGVFQKLLSNQMGCDSLVITTITEGTPDTTLIFKTSCDSSSLGVIQIHYTSIHACDSVIITSTTYSAQDSTFLTSASCDPDEVGYFVEILQNQFGCDSIVTTTVSMLPSSESFISSTTCDPSSVGNFDHMLVNQFGCDSIVHQTVSLLLSSTTFLSSTTCSSSQAGTFVTTLQNQFGCDSIVTLTVSLIPADTTQLISKTCDPAQVGSTQNTFINQDGCDSLVILTTELFLLPQLNVQVTSDFNGYGISCFGETDGSAIANVIGVSPYQYLWSTGSPDQSFTGLSSGDYFVTITDANGCQTESSVSITEPEEFSIGFEVAQPDCFGHNQGSITVMQSGGVQPIRYSIDGINFQSSSIFSGLNSGTYTMTAIDANDCDVQEIIWINVPLDIHVDLGMDRIILPGDTTILEAIVNVPFDSLSTITWSGLLNPNCPTCLTQPVAPIITTAYFISVSNSQGCSDQDSVIVFIQKNIDIYIPNVFSPNGDGINDRLVISAASEVEEIESMEIFDRWGNLVFASSHFPPNDPAYAWDGTRHVGGENSNQQQVFNPAVFAFRMMARFKDGRREVRNGDVTLIR
jgi:gliding motility-associated-like protein